MTRISKKILIVLLILILILTGVLATGCQSSSTKLQDGYYTAEDKNGNHGWYEYITIYVNDGEIVSCEYNAKNESGFIKSWDMNYMRNMNAVDDTYPNEYTRNYAKQFLDAKLTDSNTGDKVDGITRATHSYLTFVQLADAVIEKAKAGDATVALVDVPHDYGDE